MIRISDPTFVVEKAEGLVKENRMKDALLVYSDWLDQVLRSPRQIHRHKQSIAIAYNNRGHLKYLMVDFDGAVQDYNSGLEYNSILPCIYYNRGTIMYRMGYFDKAVQDMLVATRLSPECTDFQVALQRCMDQLVRVHGPLLIVPDETNSEETNDSKEGEEETEDQVESLPIAGAPSMATVSRNAKNKPRSGGEANSSSSPANPVTKSDDAPSPPGAGTSARLRHSVVSAKFPVVPQSQVLPPLPQEAFSSPPPANTSSPKEKEASIPGVSNRSIN